jgi:hypothetical protein
VDEIATNISLAPLYAWSRRGERAYSSAPRNWGKYITLLASMTCSGMGAVTGGGGTYHPRSLRSLQRASPCSLADARTDCGDGQPLLPQGLSGKRAHRERECELIYLPPYSADLNPIEEAFAQIKALLRRVEARTREALIEAMGWSLDEVTASDARGFFEHRGYRPLAQPL